MPERRTASSPGLHGTPRKKPKDRESPSELDRRLGFKENLTAKKDTSQDHVRLTEYEDGTTRPMFKRRLRRIVADEGQLSQLECVISGTPQPKVLWLKNNRPLKASDGCQVVVDEESNILVFPKVSEDDAGVYTARAMNVNGSVMCTAELALSDGKAIDPGKEPTGTPMDLDFTTPAYFFQMSSCQVEEGRLARFDCRVVAYPKPEIVWMKDGKVVESEDRFKLLNFNNEIYSLLIQDVQHEDSGRYTCWARNKFGEAMTEAFLNVISLSAEDEQEGDQAPKFFTKFYDQQTTEGLEADFKCLIGGRPAPSVTWLLDDIELQDAPGVRLRRKDGMASLEVKSPTVDQSGQYTCHITNALGEATCSAHLTVIENKLRGKMLPKFLKKFDHVTVREGEEAVFTAVVVGEPKAKVTWMYNDKPLDASRRFVMKQDGDNYTLTVKNTRFDDSGKISCKAVNEEGEVYCYGNLLVRESRFMRDTPEKLPYKPESAKVDSKFGYIPTFTKRLQDTSVNEGGQARLECKVMGIPEPEVTWMKDGRVIPPVGRYHEMREGETCRLTIDNVRPEDQGVYTCIVSNNQGKSSSSAEVKMAGAGKKDTYTPDRTLADSYLKRPYGESPERFEALPKILAVPKMPYDRPTLLNKRDDSVRLAWLPAPTHDLPMDGRRLSYTIESKEIGGPRRDWKTVATDVPGNTYNVRNLRPDREYEFRVRAQNQYGPSEPTRPSTLEKRVDDVTTIGELPEVRAPPRLPTHRPIITDMGEDTVRLAWRPVEPYKSKRTPPVSYRLEAKELPGRDWMPMSESLRDTTHYLSDLSRERDYMIRVRAENDFGVSEPTEPLWLPRATAFPGVPISRPEIVELEPQRARLSWSRVDIPAFGLDDAPLTYMLEAAEPPHDWRTIARDIDDTDYTVDGLKPGRDYRFRVRAKTPAGVVSEPSPAVSLYSTLAKSRAPVDRLEVLDLEPETRSAHLGWSRVEIPPYNAEDEPLMYMIEYNEPPVDDWRPLVTGVPTNQYRVMNLDPERDYNFRIRALTPYGVSPPSATLPVSLRHTPDTRRLSDAVIISDVDSDSLQLSWRRPMVDPSQDVSYQIQMLEQPLLDWRPIATGVTDTTYKVHGLRPKRDYQFRVIPQIGSRPLEPIPTVALSATAVRPRLHAAEPQLTELGPESVRLSWRPAEVPVYERKKPSIYYGVEKMELPSGSWVPAARRLTDTQHTLTGLRPDRDYRFRVTAETDTLTASEPSMAATMYRRPAPMFSRDEPVIRDLSPNVVTMSWHPAAIPAGLARPPNVTYNVEVQSPPGMSAWTTLYAAHATPSARLADLRPDKDYLVRVRAQYDDHVTEPTLPVYIPRRAVPPRMPVEEPYVVDVQPESVKLQWRSADLPMHIMDYSPISYRIEGRELPGGQWVNVARGVPHTDFTITGLSPDKDYEFRVKAENNYGLSDATRPITLTKRAVAPVLAHDEPLIYDLGHGSARLSWRPATMPSHLPRTSPTTYTIQVQDAPSKTWRPYIKRIPHTSYYVSGLDATKDYNFRVVADNDFGSSRPTQPVYMPKYADLHVKRPISMPEVDEFDDDLTSVKLHWKPRAGSPFDSYQGGYQIESWEPVKRKWRSVAKGIPGTSYHLRDLPAVPDHLFRVRMETDHASLSEPSLPVSVSRYLGHPRMPIHRPQLYEVDLDSAMLSWQPVHVESRRPVRYSVEQREIPEPKWRHVGNDILDTNYRLRSLRPKSDYEFRVRALIDGESSEPSFPVPLYRKAAIPRVQLDTPEVYDVVDDALTLRWNKVDVPAFSADDEPLTFIVERQQLPSYEWEPVATDITDSTYRVKDLQPYQDYSFRIRGLYPSGYTEPSPAVPVYRRPIRQSVPIARPEVCEEDPYSARLQWQRAYIPRYYGTDTPRYRIEMQDVGPAAQALDEWRPVATNVTTPAYTVNELSPRKDYKFRIREELENGDLSEPTPPIHYYRTQMPMTREPFMLAEYKPVDYTDTTFANRTYVQHLTKFVPPRMPIDKPEMVVINPETVELAWKPARVPEAIRNSSNLTYTIEVRTPPSFDWRELTSGLKVLNHTVKKLHTRIDYVFRVRAWNEYGCSEPGLPVSLYRPKIHDTAAELAEEELWEQDFERRFSQQVPPKLPMDTPKVLTRSPESIWLSWKPARIPAYATQTPITYYIEVKRAPGTSYHREVSGLVDCQYIMEGLNPSQDYSIQVRAETEHGVSDPTLPVLIQRSKPSSRPGSRRSSLERDLAAEEVNLETMRLDNVTAGAPPRMSSHRPLASNVHPDHLTMTWSAARLPSYVKHSQITYIIERRDLPSHVWTVLARDVTDMRYDVKGLSPDTDYMFRVKARNEFGLSEPTLPMSIYRDRDDYVPQKIRSRSDSRDSILSLVGRRGRRGSSVDYTRPDVDDVDVCMRDKIPTQPEYATAVTSDTQYGAEGKKGRISLQVRGFPLPTINWYLNDEKLEYGEGYNAYVTPTGGVTLEINNITPDKIGQYKCFAQNGSGSAIKMIDFRPADPPTVLEPLKDVVSQSYRDVTLTCRADGTPAPTVKWMKDWRPITESSRVTVSQEAPDTWSITLTNVLTADGGVYACSIENMGGKVTSAARLTVEEDAPAIQDISLKTTPIEDAYHILEEVDRDRHSVHRRVIEKATGKSYVAKFISLRNKAQKNFFLSEFEMLRALSQTEGVVTLHDAFETDRSLVLITEPLSGKPVTDQLLADGNWAERDVADVIRRLLGVMTTLQSQDIVHLDIKPSNVWLGGASGRDVLMTGFDLARQLLAEEEITHNYGSVGYTSPEQITDGVISPTTDTWAVGVLAYALLSGALPFDGPTDIDVLQRTKDCLWSFGDDFENISQEGRDFISKLLVKDPRERMTVARCLSHAWLTTSSDSALDVGKLRRLSDADKQERESHSVNTTANLQSLLKLMHGESALYQPAIDLDSGEIIFPDQDEYGDFLDEDAWYEWNLQCRDDPDVQEFPLASKEFRIRESRHTAADDAPSDKETDEHADSEEAGANIMFRNKIQNETFMVGDDVTFSCTVVSPDSPAVVTWYRDETLLSDAYRAEPTFTDDGVARLTIRSAKDYDAGVYKCVARNKDKRVSCQARLLLGDLPGKPGRPVVTQTSGTEVFLTWTGPVSDGNAYLLGYRVDYKAPGDVHWTRGPYVTEDYAIIGGLAPSTEYMFRISCHNKYGTSPYSWASIPITTKDEYAPPITMSSNLAPLLQFSSFSRQQMTLPVESRRPSVTAAEPATTRDGRPEDDYKILDTISRGKFAEYKNCTHIATNTARVMKIIPYTTDRHSDVTHEFETLKSIRQINIVTVIESYVTSENFYVIFERLSGINVIEYLCLRKTYTEEMVARIVRQVMDALQHLKHYGIAHLNLQPSSVVMATRKRLHVKLRDFTQSREIESGKELPMTPAGYTDFIAPEIIQGEPVGHPADVWSLGVLSFALLSGVSPFAGKDIHETLTHVIYGRYSNMDLYDNVSKESAKFINKLLKRIASNRPTINKCLDSRWLHLSDSMMKSRTSRHFRTERLREFQAEYQQRRADDKYTNVGGVKPEDLPKKVEAVADRLVTEAIGDALAVAAATE